MRKYSFKLFSSNLQNNPQLVEDAAKWVGQNSEQMFIELMVVNQTTDDDMKKFTNLLKGLEVTIHAPHNAMGFDTGKKDLEKTNREILAKAQKAADALQAKVIVVHAGGGREEENIRETARQFKLFNDARIVIENLACDADDVTEVMHGNTPEEISYIMQESGCGFCFDFSHAVCAANYLGLDIEKQLSGFYNLKPRVYHICDGLLDGQEDLHLHFGQGNYPLKDFLHKYTDENAMVTMETGGIPKDLTNWINDFNYLRSL